jgi:Icc-related predicted phosphoesterase
MLSNIVERTIKIVAVSDTHMYHGKLTDKIIKANADVLVHCGDMTDSGSIDELSKVIEWLGMIKKKGYANDVCVIAGNHDRALENSASLDAKMVDLGIDYLQDSGTSYKGFRFYGSPWTHGLRSWGFQYDNVHGPGSAVWDKIPENTDVLITHSPPIRTLSRDQSDWGCPHLKRRVDEIAPMAHLFGHVHSQHGILRTEKTLFVNASSWTSEMRIMNDPIVFSLRKFVSL